MVAMADYPRRPAASSRRSLVRRGFSSKIPDSIFGSYIDEVRCMVKANGDRYWYSTNDLYSVYCLTDSSGDPVERYTYDPYGKVTVLAPDGVTTRTASLYGNPWTFTGRRLDQETGLMYYRNRMYSTELGRFCGRDPIQPLLQWVFMYQYALGTPARYVDPTGLYHLENIGTSPSAGFGENGLAFYVGLAVFADAPKEVVSGYSSYLRRFRWAIRKCNDNTPPKEYVRHEHITHVVTVKNGGYDTSRPGGWTTEMQDGRVAMDYINLLNFDKTYDTCGWVEVTMEDYRFFPTTNPPDFKDTSREKGSYSFSWPEVASPTRPSNHGKHLVDSDQGPASESEEMGLILAGKHSYKADTITARFSWNRCSESTYSMDKWTGPKERGKTTRKGGGGSWGQSFLDP